MDNITHSLVGWTLGETGLKRKTRKGLAALIVGANAPDIDVFFGHAPWEPLAMHRGFTHGLIGGVIVLPLLLAGLLWLVDRWQVRRGASFKSGLEMDFRWLLALAFLGTLTHPFLDLLTTYSVQLWSPLTRDWWHADALFIIDIGLWLILPVSLELSRRREMRGRSDWGQPARIGVAVALTYIAFNLGLSERAKADLHARVGSPLGSGIFASPPPVAFWRRDLVWREGDGYARARWDPLAGGLSAPPYRLTPANMDDPLVRQAIRQRPRLSKFLGWSVMPVALVERSGCIARVTIADARYGDPRSRRQLSRGTEVAIPGCKEGR